MTCNTCIDFDDISHDPMKIVGYRPTAIAAKAHMSDSSPIHEERGAAKSFKRTALPISPVHRTDNRGRAMIGPVGRSDAAQPIKRQIDQFIVSLP